MTQFHKYFYFQTHNAAHVQEKKRPKGTGQTPHDDFYEKRKQMGKLRLRSIFATISNFYQKFYQKPT